MTDKKTTNTEKKQPTKAGAVELTEEETEAVHGGLKLYMKQVLISSISTGGSSGRKG